MSCMREKVYMQKVLVTNNFDRCTTEEQRQSFHFREKSRKGLGFKKEVKNLVEMNVNIVSYKDAPPLGVLNALYEIQNVYFI